MKGEAMAEDTRTAGTAGVVAEAPPSPRRVPFDAPWAWLAAGWRDVWSAPHVSLAYGMAFAVAAAVISVGLLEVEALSLFLALAGGFLLIGPFLAVALYVTSRRLAQGKDVVLGDVIFAWLSGRGQIGFFGAALLFIYLVWLQLALLLFMLFLGGSGLPPPSRFMHELLFTPQGLGLLVVGTIVGGVLASIVFAISAFAVPMLLVRQMDAVSAARASVEAVVRNPKPMALWAALIVVIMAAGFATLLIGLVVAFPLIGHATWHAYVDVFGDPEII